MATYKVLQDIEAEDKLLGPLTLKQFIFAMITATCAYLSFLSLMKGLWFFLFFLLPPILFFGFMAWPWGRDQPTEVWLLAKLRFMLKVRRRVWDQAGLKELVTITAPIKEDKNYTNGLSEGEVRSRLKALASTIDSRGWAIKNVNVSLYGQPGYGMANDTDRLIGVSALPQQVTNADIHASDDILDELNNPTAQNLDRMISATAGARKQRLIKQLKKPQPEPATQPANDYWFLSQTNAPIPAGQAVFDGGVTVRPEDSAPGGTDNDPIALAQLQSSQATKGAAYGNMRTIQPVAPVASTPPATATKPSDKTPDPAILKLASNDDLDVATIARQANKKASDLGDGEVVVPLR